MRPSAVYTEIAPAVEQAVNATARRWPGVYKDDLVSAAWTIALESLERFDPEKGLSRLRYVSATLRRALPAEARRVLCPVHLPQNKEHQHSLERVGKADGATAEAALLQPSVRHDPEEALRRVEVCSAVRQAVEGVTEDPALRSLLLSGGDLRPRHLAHALGGTPEQWQRRTRRLYEDLRGTIPASLRQELTL